MNVVILSDHDASGGAAVATCRAEAAISIEMRKNGEHNPGDVYRLVHFPDGKITPIANLWHEDSAAQRFLYRLPRKLLPSHFPRPNTTAFAAGRLREVLKTLEPDIINVHNLHGGAAWGWGPHLVEVCLEFAPVVWTLHDMWAFTGRCAYAYDCEKFIAGCDASCPTPHEEPRLPPERIHTAWQERSALFARHRDDLAIVTPSRWLAAQARRGLFAHHRIEVIPYGIETALNLLAPIQLARLKSHSSQVLKGHPHLDPFRAIAVTGVYEQTFAPLPRDEARRQLGIACGGPVLILAAFDLAERRKGAEILPLLWRHIQHRPLTVLTMGRGTIVVDDPRIDVRALGFIDDDKLKALAYSAADALLHPAPVDNFPNVVLEALACGTPTIALPVGGVPEMVRPGVSGWLADAATPEALGRAVDQALGDLSLGKNLRDSCRALAESEYSLEDEGRRYIQLFEELRRRD